MISAGRSERGASHAVEQRQLADLAVGLGANVQPGQIVAVAADLGHEAVAREVAASAYRHGARFVDVVYFDRFVQRCRLEHAAATTLAFVPSWYGARAHALSDQGCASVGLTGSVAPGLLADIDPQRVAADRLPELDEMQEVTAARTVNWTVVPAPNPGWAHQVFPHLEPDAALDALWRDISTAMRLDEPNPLAAWGVRQEKLAIKAQQLTTAPLDAIQLTGPGTDLTIGLLPSARWATARLHTVDDLPHVANLPSEEVFTTPDPRRTEGHVRATRPVVIGGAMVEGLRLEFAAGRLVSASADYGADHLAALVDIDPGAARLGEVALVDRDSRVSQLDRTLFETLLDENAASHLALGSGYQFLLDPRDAARCNASAIHVDIMIGSNRLEVTGLGSAGQSISLMAAGVWRL